MRCAVQTGAGEPAHHRPEAKAAGAAGFHGLAIPRD